MSKTNGFTEEQQSYLQGFTLGADVARVMRGLPMVSGSAAPQNGAGAVLTLGPGGASTAPAGPEDIHRQAQDRFTAEGKKLSKEETAKREKKALDMWDEFRDRAAQGVFPKGTDVFLTKFHGLFYVAPAQDAYMCRLRIPGGDVRSWQMHGLADLADRYAGGYADVTTRANLQLREIGPSDTVNVLTGLQELGILNRGAGGDNVRNVTASPTSGIDPQELIETLPLAKEVHHHILNHRELYGLPRKFNIAFDGGGVISSLESTNDIGFSAVAVRVENATEEVPAGVYFRLGLGGITGHQDFTRDTGVLLKPTECLPVANAILRVFIAHGDRTDRNKARLKYLLDAWGFDRFLAETESELGWSLRRFPLENCEPRGPVGKHVHVGIHPQKQDGLFYIGAVLPAGRLTTDQMRAIAQVAEKYGSGTIRLTVWQNLLITDVKKKNVPAVKRQLEKMGLHWDATSVRAGLVACTGNTGCKYAASNTKGQAMLLAEYLEPRITLDQPINIHLTGCPHSCAQHYVGDIGLLATNVESGEDMVEGYHIHVGGGYGAEEGIAREIYPSVAFADVPPLVERLLLAYLEHRQEEESFVQFTRRHEVKALKNLAESVAIA